MKEYFKRIRANCKTWEICFWWIFRALMIYAFIAGIVGVVKGENDLSDPLQVFANLLAMFAWEIFQMFSEKRFVRYIPSIIQDVSVIMIFAGSFGGKFMNFYYDIRWWDSAMHLISGGICVLLGYEIVTAMLKRDKKNASLPVILLCALGFSFFVSTCWELFEFTADQVMCMGGAYGDAQHWCFELAKGTPKEATLFDPVYPERWALMDTMGDIVLNTVGAVVAWVALKLFPYHHNGKISDVNAEIDAMNKQSAKRETVKK